jgi:hypothetical protein
MAGNSYRVKTKEEKGRSIFTLIDKLVKFDAVFENGLPLKYFPNVLYVTAIVILYIGNSHYSDKLIRKIDRIRIEVEDLRADFTTLKADYMFASKQSEVARKVSPIGLQESSVPPIKIVVKK